MQYVLVYKSPLLSISFGVDVSEKVGSRQLFERQERKLPSYEIKQLSETKVVGQRLGSSRLFWPATGPY